MWRDAAGYVWFSTYGVHNAGEHVLDYDTGKLIATFHGFDKYPHSPISGAYNPSGISVVGGFGRKDSVAVVAIEAIPPLPTIHSALYFVNISNGWDLTK